jgi:hypothetical protein
MSFRCISIETEVADRFRQTGKDDAGEDLRRMTVHRVEGGGAYPCRHCLGLVEDGHDALLGSYHLTRPQGAYWTPSPIFVHADACQRFDEHDLLPGFMRHRPLAVRAYYADDMMIYDLSDVAAGAKVDPLIERCVSDPRTSYANIHTAQYGCFLCRVEASEM